MTQPTGRVFYFAYGANVHPGWLRRRVPDAVLLGAAFLPGHRLAFRKRGRDGSGRSDACPVEDVAVRLPGALYEIDAGALERLGAAGAGYHVVGVELETPHGRADAVTWRADADALADGLLPWDWYLGLIRAGAAILGLPESHQQWLAAQPSAPDPDEDRAAPARALLAA